MWRSSAVLSSSTSIRISWSSSFTDSWARTLSASADRLVNIDEMSCRCVRWRGPARRRAGSAAGQPEGVHNVKTVLSMNRGSRDLLVQMLHANMTDVVFSEQFWSERTRHVTSENDWTTTFTILQLTATLNDVVNPSKGGQGIILLWDIIALIHVSEVLLTALPHVALCFISSRSTSYLHPYDVSVFWSFKSCILTKVSIVLALAVFDDSLDDIVMNRTWRHQSSAEWTSRADTDFYEKNQVWTTGRHCLDARSDVEHRDAVTETSTPWRRSRHDTSRPWRAVREAQRAGVRSWRPSGMGQDERVGRRRRRAPDASAPAESWTSVDWHPASSVRTSDFQLKRRTAPGVRRWRVLRLKTKSSSASYSQRFSVVSRVGCFVRCVHVCVSTSWALMSDP